MKKVTVVIPNYNGSDYLRECLDSLEKERNREGAPPFEVIVVDNGSEDGKVRALLSERPQVRKVFLPENTGFCHAVNVGIQMAVTPYVILLNNDTKVYPGFVGALLGAIEKDPGCFSVSARMLMWDRPELVDDAGDLYCVLGWSLARGKGKAACGYERPASVFSACGGAAIYRRSVFEEIGLFDEAHFAYLEDLDIGYRARIYGYHNRYEPEARVLHYGSASTGSRYNAFKIKLSAANNVCVIGKNMPLLQLLLNLPFLLTGFAIKACFFSLKKMGTLYLKGISMGLRRLFSKEGRAARVRFRWKHLGNYLKIQGLLYLNTFRLLTGK